MRNIKYKIVGWVGFWLISLTQVLANPVNPTNQPASIFDLMYQETAIKVTLTFPWEYLQTHRRDTLTHRGVLQFSDQAGQAQEWATQISLRGRFRRMRCAEMPPLKLKFKKKHLKAAGLSTHNDLKLVTYCQDDSDTSKTTLLKEFLAYQLYQDITDASYRVQLLEITYKDSYSGREKTQLAFLIEDTAQLRDRLGAKKPDQFRFIAASDFQTEARQNVAMFEFMIGNTDYDLSGPRNIKYMNKDGKIIPIPYDFDFSGFVDAPYALLTPKYGQKSHRDRVWLGLKEDTHLLTSHQKRFSDIRAKLVQRVKKFTYLEQRERKDLVAYLKSYFRGQQEYAMTR